MSELIFFKENHCLFRKKVYLCAFGRGGVSFHKQEGDGATPGGTFSLRQVFYRPDRVASPITGLPITALTPNMGWCDDPQDPLYNQLISLPYPGRHEELWREDHVYDLIIVVGYNDDPVVPGKGSAIFIHLARENYSPTEGCLAFNHADLLEILKGLTPESRLVVKKLV